MKGIRASEGLSLGDHMTARQGEALVNLKMGRIDEGREETKRYSS